MLAGRAHYADLLLQSTRISREHARFSIENGAPSVTDLDSRNGTYVNGRRITAPQRLQAGDEVRLHDVIIRVVQREVAADT
jgi:pSer/pThr/pTyr-binding forkhead associated (FHA) protein